MIYYMIFIFIYLPFLFWEGNIRLKKFFLILSFLLLVVFSGIRWEVGTDWVPYYDYFNGFPRFDLEIGYVWITKIIKTFTNNYNVFLLIITFLGLIGPYFVINKYSKYFGISLGFFYSYYYLNNYFGANRRIIAISLGVYLFHVLVQGKKKCAILIIILMSLFHRTALCLFMVFLIPNRRIKKRYLLVLLFISILISEIGLIEQLIEILLDMVGVSGQILSRLNEYVIKEVASEISIKGVILGLLKRGIFFIGYIFIRDKNRELRESSTYNLMINMYFISILIYIISSLSKSLIMFSVLTIYFSYVEILLFPILINEIIVLFQRNNKVTKTVVYLIVHILLIFYFIIQIKAAFSGQYSHLFLPYKINF